MNNPEMEQRSAEMQITTLASGSTGNCALIREGDTRFLIDAGISCKKIKEGLQQEGLEPRDLAGVLITHEHSDHIAGLRVLEKQFQLPVFATLPVIHALEGMDCMIPFHEIETGTVFFLDDVQVEAFSVPHDAADCVGYRFMGNGVLGYATDIGCITETVIRGLSGADVALIEANHDIRMLQTGAYPHYLKQRILSDRGHLSNDSSAKLAGILYEQGTCRFVLGHLSRNNNTEKIAYETVAGSLPLTEVAVHTAPMLGNLTVSTEVI